MSEVVQLAGRSASASPNDPLWKRAYDELSRMVQEREIPAGAAIVELQLAKQLGISRTPLRQALQRLEVEGLLRKTVNQSYVVRKVELNEYLQSLKVRELLEAEAAALSAGRIDPADIDRARRHLSEVQKKRPYNMLEHWASDDEVHELFIGRCGNEIMANLLRSLRVTTKLFEIERLSERLEPDSEQHEDILNALASGDSDAARHAVAHHIRSLFDFAIRTVA